MPQWRQCKCYTYETHSSLLLPSCAPDLCSSFGASCTLLFHPRQLLPTVYSFWVTDPSMQRCGA